MSIAANLCSRYVIFLDIDGVLLPVPKYTFGGGELSLDCVRRLARLIGVLGGPGNVTIVLTSTWRTQPGMTERLNAFIQKEASSDIPIVRDGTPNGTVLVSTVTYYPDDPSEQRLVRDRVDEIHRWLHTHVTDHPEAIGGRWLAIDDMKLDVDHRMTGHFLHTATEVGMTDDDVETACAMLKTHPSPEAAYEAAVKALTDPALKQEEIDIFMVLQERLEAKVAAITSELAEAQAQVAELSAERKELTRELQAKQQSMDDMRYRLAVYDNAKRYPALAAALELASAKTGPEQRVIDAQIKSFVVLLMERKELQKRLRGESKKTRPVAE
ncbi:hypothetical protein ABL78_4509 [Leptomonas seymouri]|uniref:Uncharacterized protein n=1 Tax=Leptomonas seymouri TaxID=5684 RepID=A0A0N1I6B2_LEPSE|nr:hypothetical protein ABL78_4509 [Leptomonas seymouri]|eukprot:KPI86430.1 hypothetical protein ABL78_4509 [Leptomonas seymouri]